MLMRKLFLITCLACMGQSVYSQSPKYVYTIKADTVKITNCDSAELVLQNHTQGVPGFLFNAGNGRTVFQHAAIRLNDSSYLVGADTVVVPVFRTSAWLQGGNAFGATGALGTLDNHPVYFYANGTPWVELYPTGHLVIGYTSDPGYTLSVQGTANVGSTLFAQQGAVFYNPLSFAGSTLSSNTIYANWLFFNTDNDLGNTQTGVYTFTCQPPAANSGPGAYRLIHVNKLVNRGYEDGEETAIRVDFTVTGTASDLRAFQAASGNVIIGAGNLQIGDSTGSTSRIDITGANGFSQLRLRTQYTPTSSSDTNGNQGDLAIDDNYLYYKTSTGWKRVALSTF
jgi:hypothetical protein